MHRGAQGRERDAAPTAADRAVHVTEEQVRRAARRGVERPDQTGRIGQTDAVQAGDADVEGRMVQEQIDRPVAGFGQSVAEPGRAPRAEAAGAAAGLVRIEQDQVAARAAEYRLDEAVPVARRFGESRAEGGPVVVVADQQAVRHAQDAQRRAQRRIGRRGAAVGQVAGEDAERRVAVLGVDVGEAGVQPGARVEPEQSRPRRHEMQVGHLGDLHRATPRDGRPAAGAR